MARICANDAHHAFAADDAAILAYATDRTANFHDASLIILFFFVGQKECVLNHISGKKARGAPKKLFAILFLPVLTQRRRVAKVAFNHVERADRVDSAIRDL